MMGAQWTDVSRGNPRLKPQARRLRRILREAVKKHGVASTISKGHATAIEEGAVGPHLTPARISKMISEHEDSHSEPSALWRLSEGAFREYHQRSPVGHALVLYYLGDWLLALVHAVGTARLSKIGGADSLRKHLDWLEDVDDSDSAQRVWNLNSPQRSAFYPPKKAAEKFQMYRRALDDPHGNLALAAALAETYSLSYEQRRRAVVDYLKKWLVSVAGKSERFMARPSTRSSGLR
jgi:hypothetical protein